MRHLVYFSAAICVFFSSALRAAEPPAKKLNVLLIVSDDLCADLGCYGAPVQTPNLDALAQRSVRFDRTYCQFPLCGPSRCSFLSGLRPDTTGIHQNNLNVRFKVKDVVTLPQLFRKNGYHVARVGKMYHLGIPGGVGTSGPDDPESWDTTFNPKGNEFPKDEDEYNPTPQLGQGFRRVQLRGDGSDQHDHQAATETIRLLRENTDKPFFIGMGFIRPHVPEIAPKKFFNLYDPAKIALPQVPPNDRDDIPPLALLYPQPDLGMSEADCRESIRAYRATTSFMDEQVGRVLKELDALGLADSTIVAFISDHGYTLGQHHAWQKMMLFEPVCRVPMMIAVPGNKNAGQVARGLTELVDLYPTLAELCALTPPSSVEGKSVVPLLDDPTRSFKKAVFTQLRRGNKGTGRTVRTDRWRYIEWSDGTAELYDETNDPQEITNLAKDPAAAQTLADTKATLAANWQAAGP